MVSVRCVWRPSKWQISFLSQVCTPIKVLWGLIAYGVDHLLHEKELKKIKQSTAGPQKLSRATTTPNVQLSRWHMSSATLRENEKADGDADRNVGEMLERYTPIVVVFCALSNEEALTYSLYFMLDIVMCCDAMRCG